MSALHLETFADVLRAQDQSLVPPATLSEARQRRDALASLLGREREAAADFLVALSDFDRRRGWERLGHGSLFAFLTRELALSKGAAYLRLTAARLLPRFPAVEAGLRSGRLCLSAVGELAKVLTEENESEVLPQFAGCSARDAREVAASIRPVAAPAVREVLTRLSGAAPRVLEAAPPPALFGAAESEDLPSPVASFTPALLPSTASAAAVVMAEPGSPPVGPSAAPASRPAGVVLTSEPPLHRIAAAPRATTEPLTADLRRLHLTVSKGFLEKVERARHGRSHASPNATMEQVLEAALDLLLERQARRKALVKRPRSTVPQHLALPSPPPTPTSTSISSSTPTLAPPAHRPDVPAAVERAVRLRDGDRCQFPLDAGGVCGSTWRVELDHVVPFALGGETSVANLRCLCERHNRAAAEAALGAGARQRRGRRRTTARAAGQAGWPGEPPLSGDAAGSL